MSLKAALKHAFHVDPPGPAEPDDRTRDIVDTVCRSIVKRGMVMPALMTLDMCRPLNFVAAQAMHVIKPAAEIVLDTESYTQFALFLEKRGSVEYLCNRLEQHAAGEVPDGAEEVSDSSPGSTPDQDS